MLHASLAVLPKVDWGGCKPNFLSVFLKKEHKYDSVQKNWKKGGERIEATKQHLSVETSHIPLAVSSTFKLLTSAAVLNTLGLPLSLIIVYISLSLSLCHPTHSPVVSSIFCSVRETHGCVLSCRRSILRFHVFIGCFFSRYPQMVPLSDHSHHKCRGTKTTLWVLFSSSFAKPMFFFNISANWIIVAVLQFIFHLIFVYQFFF